MKGDFSKWNPAISPNYKGVLHQQGRVLLDSDWNDNTRILNTWQETAARDIIGVGMAAIPAEVPDSFQLIDAQVIGSQVQITFYPGRAWVDGELVALDGTGPITRTVNYWPEGSATPATIGAGIRDAVVLEIWQESLNAFQQTEELIEPALGGPDSTERAQVGMDFRLMRLDDKDTCSTLPAKLQDDFSALGKLTASLQPTTNILGDCPVVDAGGYTGFEHYLYRIEIARLNAGKPAMFKWSLTNGGLVGRGDFDASNPAKKIITLTANKQAIKTSQWTNYYLEVVQFDNQLGCWQVTFGAEAILNGDVLEIGQEWHNPAPLPSGNVFFRLWNGLKTVSSFPKVTAPTAPQMLRDGICLEFDAPTATNYRPGDYWIFPVRAGEIQMPNELIKNEPPQGVHYHRAALGILEWNAAKKVTATDHQIDDCRHVFRPLTNQKICCTYTIGDGISSQGDFNSVEEALDQLPKNGGQLCLMPGVHNTNLVLKELKNIRITGCGDQTFVSPRPEKAQDPIFTLQGCENIQIDGLTLVNVTGTAILGQASETQALLDIRIQENRITGYVHAIWIESGQNIKIRDNQINMIDKAGGEVAVFLQAEVGLIEKNELNVIPFADANLPNDPDNPTPGVYDPCREAKVIYRQAAAMRKFVNQLSKQARLRAAGRFHSIPKTIEYKAQGGIQIGSSSQQIQVLQNRIWGGCGQGIVLGHIPSDSDTDGKINSAESDMKDMRDMKDMKDRKKRDMRTITDKMEFYLYQLDIHENSIFWMGRDGIGVAAFFNLNQQPYMFTVQGGFFSNNDIQACLLQLPEDMPPELKSWMGYGGIALAAAEDLTIRENRIENNGPDQQDPISGIFILHGQRIDISDNRINNNGPYVEVDGKPDIKIGWRGGIVVAMSFKEIGSVLSGKKVIAHPDSIPAVKIHNNIVVQPLGQALLLVAMGPVSVIGNHFTSHHVDYRITPGAMLAGTVLIENLGVAKDIWPWILFSQYKQLGKLSMGSLREKRSVSRDDVAGEVQVQDWEAILEQYLRLPSGNILFNDNRTTLDLRDAGSEWVVSSQMLLSLDDISFNNNQSECDGIGDIVFVDTVLMAFSIRTCNNRFQEGLTFSIYSLLSLGLMNTTAHNQATHCLLPLGLPDYLMTFDNAVIVDYLCPETNRQLNRHLGYRQMVEKKDMTNQAEVVNR